ncbi:MAG: hypothetical protein BMS9Abin36_0099 [Gammaproteobacteria bacterium]|nr:MAG: hypothetical protein BMS9Abin36_0099 [Gammaproteobacteria bacterium]
MAATPETVLENIKDQLEGLKRTSDGALLYRMIQRGLGKFSGNTENVESAFARFLYVLLGKYAQDPSGNPVTRVKARMIQQRLSIHISDELQTDTPSRKDALGNKSVGHKSKPETVSSPAVEVVVTSRAPDNIKEAIKGESNKVRTNHVENKTEEKTIKQTDLAADALDEMFEEIQGNLIDRITDSIMQNQEFSALLRSNLKALRLAESGEDMLELRELLVRGMEELVDDQENLSHQLAGADRYLKAAEHDRQQMQERLYALTKHSICDELTGLPKKQSLLKSLAAEVGRCRRYGSPLVLAIIDIDGLGQINREFGNEAGDRVLLYYVREILSQFRAYDITARYGGDEFAIIFPATQKDGALRALEKAQQLCVGILVNYKGQSFRLPGFSSVLTVYAHGEDPETLLQRAARALDMAGHRGQGSTPVVSLPPQD